VFYLKKKSPLFCPPPPPEKETLNVKQVMGFFLSKRVKKGTEKYLLTLTRKQGSEEGWCLELIGEYGPALRLRGIITSHQY
jgi:hypothetical protein